MWIRFHGQRYRNTAAGELGSGDGGGAGPMSDGGGTTGNSGTPPPDQLWYSGIADEATRNWVEAKGFKDPSSVAQSAYNLEKLIGHDRAGNTLVIPGEDATPEQIAEYRTKLGVPATPDDYKLPIPEGQSDTFAKEAANWMHEAGIPAKQAEQLAAKWNDYAAGVHAQTEQQFNARAEQESAALKQEWGAAYDQNVEIARRAAQQFMGGDKAKIDAIERAIGTGETFKLLNAIGKGLGEHKLASDTDGGQFGAMTPAQAKSRIEQLRSNREYTAAYLNGDMAKQSEMAQLHQWAYPELS